MPAPPSTRAAYRARISAVQAEVARRLTATYGTSIDPNAIADSFHRFIPRAEDLIAAGQASVASVTEAYLDTRAADSGVDLALDDLPDLAGTTRDGEPLASGMAAWGPMVLGQIGEGASLEDALGFGQYLATRFGDNELTGVVDRIHEADPVRSALTGWEGIVAPGSCDACQENAGTHPIDWQPYRHPGCNCDVEPVFGGAG